MKQIFYERLIQYILENQDRFYRVAYSYTRHQEDALDVVQNAVCKALEAHESIKNEDAIRTWFYRILINECLTVLGFGSLPTGIKTALKRKNTPISRPFSYS